MKPRALLWAAMTAYAAGFASLSILRHRAFATGRYDLGNMVQTVWNTAHGNFLQMTSGDGRQISRLAVMAAAIAPPTPVPRTSAPARARARRRRGGDRPAPRGSARRGSGARTR